MNRRLSLGLGALALGLMWALSGQKAPEPVPVEAPKKDVERIKDDKPARQRVADEPQREPESVAPSKIWPDKPFPYQKQLDDFLALKEKVLPSAAEQAELAQLLSDSSLLRAIGLRLTETSLAPTVRASQDAAVGLLVEALKTGDKALASEIARQVVEDPQVENASFDRGVRENLAGIKAEVLYHWAALAPDDAASVERSLPGPVSQKIWANVAHRHASNRAESASSP